MMGSGNIIRPIWLNDTRANSDRKRIVCFGDSFISANNAIVGGTHFYNMPFHGVSAYQKLLEDYGNNPEFAAQHQGHVIVFDDSHPEFIKNTENWMTKTAIKLDYDFVSYGLGGTGTYYAYYSMLDYLQFQNHQRGDVNPPDVIIFVMGMPHRIWNQDIPNVCPGMLQNATQEIEAGTFTGTGKHEHIWKALGHYYADLFDNEHELQQKVHLMHYLDTQIAPQYPETKFVILHSFPDGISNDSSTDYHGYSYYYDFKNCMEIRPPLIYFSEMHEMPDDLKDESRSNHFSPLLHELFSEYLYLQIQNFKPGGHFCPIQIESDDT